MMRKDVWAASFAIALIALCALPVIKRSVRANSSGFTGLVSNMGTGLPVSGARISAAGQSVTTDQAGRYLLSLPTGSYKVRAEAGGYVGIAHSHRKLDGASQATLDFEMIPKSPSPEEAAIIDEKMIRPSQEPLDEGEGATLARSYGLSSVADPPATIRVLMPDDTVVLLSMDEYLKGVVPHEMPPYWPTEALRAQAVAARSYASTRSAHLGEGADVCTTTHCQVWNATHYDTTDQAVDDTHGVVARYGGSVIYAFFFAHCDGHTRDASEVWGGDLPYCRSVPCPCGHETMYGHGVGMCQHGARVLAEEGYSYVDILKHYYSGVEVSPPVVGPDGSVAAPAWSNSTWVSFALTSTNAVAVQFSWIWEGEELRQQENSGEVITDTDALNGWARVGRVGDTAGYWHGPYTCELELQRDYQVYFRLKNPNSSAAVQLANLDVADDQGRRIYASRPLFGTDFAQDYVYQEFRLELAYGNEWPTCDGPEEDGLEFRIEFLGSGDLYLDRVAVFDAPQSLTSPLTWQVRSVEGPQTVIVRFLDVWGNSSDCTVTVKLDVTAPEWSGHQTDSVVVQDAISGLDTASAAWAASLDGGATWEPWQPITLTASSGITLPVELSASPEPTTLLRFRIQDLAGNVSESASLPSGVPAPGGERLMLPLILRG